MVSSGVTGQQHKQPLQVQTGHLQPLGKSFPVWGSQQMGAHQAAQNVCPQHPPALKVLLYLGAGGR